MSIAIVLHALAAAVWVGGMFFASVALRPAAAMLLAPQDRVALWSLTLGAFFRWVWIAIAALLVTGYWMIFAGLGGMAGAGVHVHAMQGLGISMMMIFLHVYFSPYRRLERAVQAGDPAEAERRLAQIRRYLTANLVLGLLTVAVATGGRYLD